MPDKATGRVLIVDDEPNAIKVLSAILREEGYAVSEAQDVMRAEKILAEEDVDAVITDMKMPSKDGYNFWSTLPSTILMCHLFF